MKLLQNFFLSGLALIILGFGFSTNLSASPTNNMKIEMVTPQTGDRFGECTDILVSANVTIETGEIKDVRFYRNGVSLGVARKQPYERTWKNALPGYYAIWAKAQDKESNEAFSDTVYIRVGNIQNGDLIINGEFSCQMQPWSLNYHQGAVARYMFEPDGWISEGNQIEIEIENGGTEIWHIQLAQNFAVDSGHTYQVSFGADALEDKVIEVMFQENQEPWAVYWTQSVEITGPNIYGPFTFENFINDPGAVLRFNIGGNTTTVFFDAVSIIDPSVNFVDVQKMPSAQNYLADFSLSQNFPNPFNSSTVIQYYLPENAEVTLEIFNLIGQQITTLTSGKQTAGIHQMVWDGTDALKNSLPSGLYFYRLKATSKNRMHTFTKKLLLLE